MKNQRMSRFILSLITACFVLIITGCADNGNQSTSTPGLVVVESDPTFLPIAIVANTISPTSTEGSEFTSTASPVSTMELDKNVLYRDDFTNPSTGWPQKQADNYITAYSEGEYYKIQILNPNIKYPIYIPNKLNFEDGTIEVKVLTKTTDGGDFNYGLVFRRSGNEYYAFTISPLARKWYVLKSTSDTGLKIMDVGASNSIHAPGTLDILSVLAKGSIFSFRINGVLAYQFNDPDYQSGEVGLFVQTRDSSDALISFDSITVWSQAKEICNNNKDDDGDNLIDKVDPDCLPPTIIPYTTKLVTTKIVTTEIVACSPDPDNPPQCDKCAPYDPKTCDCGASIPGCSIEPPPPDPTEPPPSDPTEPPPSDPTEPPPPDPTEPPPP